MRCSQLDEQAAELFRSLKLPLDWRMEVARRVRGYDKARTIEQRKASLTERLRRLTTVYSLGNIEDDEYRQTEREIKDELASLRVPELEEAFDAGELLMDFEQLWQQATLEERNRLLTAMVARVEVDLLRGSIVGSTPR